MKVASILIESRQKPTFNSRLEDAITILDKTSADAYVFPGGYFLSEGYGSELRVDIQSCFHKYEPLLVFGLDGLPSNVWNSIQRTLLIQNGELRGFQHKSYEAPREKLATKIPFSQREPVYFEGDYKLFPAICYDVFGIAHERVENPNVDFITVNIHGFYPPGKKFSGEQYFARHGLAGASKEWGVPVFAGAVFFDRYIPAKWPSGVYWRQGSKSTLESTYDSISLSPKERINLSVLEGNAEIRIYDAMEPYNKYLNYFH